MTIAIFIPKTTLREDPRFRDMVRGLASCDLYEIASLEALRSGTDVILSIGGDGTYLSAAEIAARAGIPLLGVNFGRLGFLSDCPPEKVAPALLSGRFVLEGREVLQSVVDGGEPRFALNEIAVTRIGAAMLGVDVTVDGEPLPTYWADGLLVATSSGSTAYSLSVGGPICTPDSQVLIVAPIAPHNLNVRPLIVPASTRIGLSLRSRNAEVMLTHDTRTASVDRGTRLDISLAQFSLKRVRLPETNFIGALRSKLFWGEDVRNESI
ncbi:MAG: NAD(+)/NADH kinase [Bacteroidales bacterium]|nr:NAD(+)/NADH kinase [Bacteroidales bacterium]